MKFIIIDGLWQKDSDQNLMRKLAESLPGENKLVQYFQHDDPSIHNFPFMSGDILLVYSLGGRTAIDVVYENPQVQFHSILGVDPCFGFFRGKRVLPDNVGRFLQLKAEHTLLWNFWSRYVRKDLELGSQDRYEVVPGVNHETIREHALGPIAKFLAG